MNGLQRLLTAWLIVTTLLFTLPAVFAAGEDESGARKALSRITQQLKAIETWFSDAARKRRDTLEELESADRQIATVNKRIRELDRALAETETVLKNLSRERQDLQTQRDQQAQLIAEHLAAAQRLSGQDFFKMLLNQENPDQFDRMIRYHTYFSHARSETLVAYKATLEKLTSNANVSQERKAHLAQQQRALEQERNTLKQNRSQREILLANLARESRSKEAEREQLARDQKRLETLLAELASKAETPDGEVFRRNKGALPWPVKGAVLHAFGQSRAGGRLHWQGIQIAAAEDTPIAAVHQGRVVFSDWLRGFGLLIILDHGSGFMSLYAHADSLYKRTGDWVEGGETIAAAGRSGGSERSGIYFEIRSQGKPRDPIVWLGSR